MKMKNRHNSLLTDKVVCEGNNGWFVGIKYDALFSIDFEKGKYQLLKVLPYHKAREDRAYWGCNKVKGYIYIFPMRCNGTILVSNTKGEIVKEIEIENPNKINVNIVDTCVCGDKIYVMALGLKKILVLDIESSTINEMYSIYENVEIKNYRGNIANIDNVLYFSIAESNKVYILDTVEKKLDQCTIPIIKNGIYSFGQVGKQIWMTSTEESIYLWEPTHNHIKEINQFPKGFGKCELNTKREEYFIQNQMFYEGGFLFWGIDMGEELWLIPCYNNMVLCLNMITHNIRGIELPIDNKRGYMQPSKKAMFRYIYFREERYIGVYSLMNDYIIEIDIKTYGMVIKDFSISSDEIKILQVHSIQKKGLLEENPSVDLENYLSEGCKNRREYKRTEIGMKIYNYIKYSN